MKNTIKIALLAAAFFVAGSSATYAQEDRPIGKKIEGAAKDVGQATSTAAKDVGNATATGAKAVGKKTSELTSKGAAAVVDKKYDGKAGPNGELIYINDKAQFYYVNKAGHRVYLTKAELRDKPSN